MRFRVESSRTPLSLKADIPPTKGITAKISTQGGTNDYEKLINKPTLNGKTIIGDIEEIDPTVSDWAKQPKKPEYTPDEVDAVSKDDAIPIEWLAGLF